MLIGAVRMQPSSFIPTRLPSSRSTPAIYFLTVYRPLSAERRGTRFSLFSRCPASSDIPAISTRSSWSRSASSSIGRSTRTRTSSRSCVCVRGLCRSLQIIKNSLRGEQFKKLSRSLELAGARGLFAPFIPFCCSSAAMLSRCVCGNGILAAQTLHEHST